MNGHVGWPEFGAVVVAVLCEAVGGRAGLVQISVCLAAVVLTSGGYRKDELSSSVQGQFFRLGGRGTDHRAQGVGGGSGDLLGLGELAKAEKYVRHREHARGHRQRCTERLGPS
jgi:hypothetical protein